MIKSVPIQEALGHSEAFLAFQERLSRVARIDRPILLIGERGTGKELAAARVHYLSTRWRGPLVTLNCAALSPSLIEPELFGYEAGAFTGAERRRAGRFEVAHEGTLFLDEVGNIPLEAQAKILRVIEYGTFERVGSPAPVRVDVRIVGATHANLPALVQEGRFKPDLLDRLSFDVLVLPPLRHRGDDMVVLANHFAARMAHELGRQATPQFSEQALAALRAYPWPGNVRELKNVIERAVYQADSATITEIVFDPFQPQPGVPQGACVEPTPYPRTTSLRAPLEPDSTPPLAARKPFADAVRELEVRLLQDALRQATYNQRQAAVRLGLSYHQFRGLYRKYRDFLSP